MFFMPDYIKTNYDLNIRDGENKFLNAWTKLSALFQQLLANLFPYTGNFKRLAGISSLSI